MAKPVWKKKNIAIGILIGVLLLLCIVYFGFVIFFQDHYLFHTTVGNVKCGGKTSEYVVTRNQDQALDYLLTIYDRNHEKYHLSGMDFSYEYVNIGEEERILKKQNAFLWPASLFQSYTYPLAASVTFDKEALAAQTDALSLFSEDAITPPENAYINILENSYEIVPEVLGTQPIRDAILEEITSAVTLEETELTLSDRCYTAPDILSTDPVITDAAAQLDHYMNAQIHYEINNAEENLTSGQILSMLEIGENGEVTVNTDKINKFVQKLASTYNTYGDVREFTTSKGDTISIGGGDYGWVINKTKEAEQILADLKGGQPVSREPVYEQRALLSGLDDIGNTYVEIDYTNQHLWFYKEGTLVVETDIVSGNINRSNGSPDGIYKIVYKQRNATLIGEDYASAVSYFMPFAYNVGIHDADWRSQFGGEIYKSSGSHGCINVPPEIAKTIYENIETGTPVIAYYREPVTLTAENARISNAFSYVKTEN